MDEFIAKKDVTPKVQVERARLLGEKSNPVIDVRKVCVSYQEVARLEREKEMESLFQQMKPSTPETILILTYLFFIGVLALYWL